MPQRLNLTADIKYRLPAELVDLVEYAAKESSARGENLYLVGGVVRDLLLHRPLLDLDLIVEGSAIYLAQTLAPALGASLTAHEAFNTAKLRWDCWTVDIASVRSENYDRPGALPAVKQGTLSSDLYRRDFTVNAMAVDLNPYRYGELIDPLGGLADLRKRIIRVLHAKSFIDDATRIWRAIRYEQRLGFRIEPETEQLSRRDLPMLNTISGARIRHELELVMKEERPEYVVRRADRLGVLERIHPSLKGDEWIVSRFARARRLFGAGEQTRRLYFALLGYRLSLSEAEYLLDHLSPPRSTGDDLMNAIGLKGRLDTLASPNLTGSQIFRLLEEYSETAVSANTVATDSPVVRRRLRLYSERLRTIKPEITGLDLIEMGIPPGPNMRAILQALRNARLDGKARSRRGEVRMVEEWKRQHPVDS
jgi:tRNA nucleotidyltransferase (CCA-adding enzyme)